MPEFFEEEKKFNPVNIEKNKNDYELERQRNLENARKELDKLNLSYDNDRASIEQRRTEDLKRAEDDTLTDRFGQEIPVEWVKKPLGTRKEKPGERRQRLIGIVNRQYDRELHMLEVRKKRAQEKVEYYMNRNIVNRVDHTLVDYSFSQKRRRLLKTYIRQNVSSDRGKLFAEGEEDKAQAFKEFLNACEEYATFDPFMAVERIREGSKRELNEDYGERDREIDMCINMKKKMDALRNKAGDDASVHMILDGYEKLIGDITGGNLSIPENVQITEIGTDIKVKDPTSKNPKTKPKKLETQAAKEVPLFAHEPSVDDCIQGIMGDCYLVTAIGAIASTEPQIIKNSMKDNGDGTVTVRLYKFSVDDDGKIDKVPRYYKVPKVMITKNGARGAVWTNVMELAYCAHRRETEKKYDIISNLHKKLGGQSYVTYSNTFRSVASREWSRIKKANSINDGKENEDAREFEYRSAFESRINNEMEKVINESPDLKKIYQKELDKINKGPMDLSMLSAGYAGVVYSAITGNADKGSYFITSSAREINQLNHFMDNMLTGYMENHKNEWSESGKDDPDDDKVLVEKLSLGFIACFLKERQPANTVIKEDPKTKQKDIIYTNMMTRKQLGEETQNALNELESLDVKSPAIKQLNKKFRSWYTDNNLKDDLSNLLKKKGCTGEELFQQIINRAAKIFSYASDHHNENTIYNYERFSGQYSPLAKSVFARIKKATGERMVVTAGTHQFEKVGEAEKGDAGEPVFDGIASRHAYIVTGTTTEMQGEKTIYYVRVRNPWNGYGVNYVEKNGKIEAVQDKSDVNKGETEIELNDFMSRFRSLDFGPVTKM